MKLQIAIIVLVLIHFTVNADVQMSPELECCVETNSKLETQINNQALIISQLEGIKQELVLDNDTLMHSLKIAVENIKQEESEKGFDYISLIGALLGATISGGAVIFVFYLGHKADKKKESQGYIDFGEQIFVLLKNLVSNSEKQRDLINTYLKSIKENPHTHGNYGKISLNLFERAKSFDTTLVFKSFKELKLENTTYIKYYKSLDYLYGLYTLIDEDYRSHNSEVVTPLSNEFIKLRQQILDMSSIYLKNSKEKGEDSTDFYKFLNELIIKYYTSEKRPKGIIDIKYDVETIIRPLKEELIKDKYSGNSLANELIILAKRAGDYYQTILDQAKLFHKGLSSRMESINTTINELNEIKNNLSNKYAS
ncbi:MAG: hypothetical protein N4A49_05430 [Marinifilaceae bacterium]|jgi:hypothetical protein|nr:hypothetical protein [Marinifilaceae bacterium]